MYVCVSARARHLPLLRPRPPRLHRLPLVALLVAISRNNPAPANTRVRPAQTSRADSRTRACVRQDTPRSQRCHHTPAPSFASTKPARPNLPILSTIAPRACEAPQARSCHFCARSFRLTFPPPRPAPFHSGSWRTDSAHRSAPRSLAVRYQLSFRFLLHLVHARRPATTDPLTLTRCDTSSPTHLAWRTELCFSDITSRAPRTRPCARFTSICPQHYFITTCVGHPFFNPSNCWHPAAASLDRPSNYQSSTIIHCSVEKTPRSSSSLDPPRKTRSAEQERLLIAHFFFPPTTTHTVDYHNARCSIPFSSFHSLDSVLPRLPTVARIRRLPDRAQCFEKRLAQNQSPNNPCVVGPVPVSC